VILPAIVHIIFLVAGNGTFDASLNVMHRGALYAEWAKGTRAERNTNTTEYA